MPQEGDGAVLAERPKSAGGDRIILIGSPTRVRIEGAARSNQSDGTTQINVERLTLLYTQKLTMTRQVMLDPFDSWRAFDQHSQRLCLLGFADRSP